MDYVDYLNEKGLCEYIVDGAYIRGLKIPHSNMITSEIWKRQRLWIVIKGDFTYWTDKIRKRIKAPYIGYAPYGESVNIYSHEDTEIYAITGTDVLQLNLMSEDQII